MCISRLGLTTFNHYSTRTPPIPPNRNNLLIKSSHSSRLSRTVTKSRTDILIPLNNMTSTAAFQDYASERDPRWEAVDDYVLANLHPPSKPNHKAVAYAMDNSLSKGLPDIATYPVFSKFLALQCRMVGATHALEVGTLGGYTSSKENHPICLSIEQH